MNKTLIKQASICIRDNEMAIKDVLFNEEEILAIDDVIDDDQAVMIDGHGSLLMSGLIDGHVHLREPGFEQKETIASGTMAAAHGGFTTIMAMPNLNPVPDDPKIMAAYRERIAQNARVRVMPYAAITKQEQGAQVVDFHALKAMGVKAFSDDGVGVQSDVIMREAMHQSAKESVLVAAHCEDMRYRLPKSCMHEGMRSRKLGVVGIPSVCEYAQIERDLHLVEETGAHYHICHMSTKESVELLAKAKEKGLDVSGEVTVHHLLLNENDVLPHGDYKMNPPLRSKEDQLALIQGLKAGVIDLIANDHAPHTAAEKAKGLVDAPFGIVSLETAFPLLYTYLVKEEVLTLNELLERMSKIPAKRFGLKRCGQLTVGAASDLVLVDLNRQWQIDPDDFYSQGRSTPFAGWSVYGKIIMTIVDGKIVYKEA